MRIKNWVGASTLASAACLLAACSGMDPSDPGATSESELGGFQSMAPAADLSQGASCIETVQPVGLECPGMSQIEVAAIQASVQPRLMSIAPMLRVTVLRTGGAMLAQIDGGEQSRAFESLFGTSSMLVPIQRDGTFTVTAPIAERELSSRGLGALGAGPSMGFGAPGVGPGFGFGAPGAGFFGAAGRLGSRALMGPIGGGPGLGFGAGQAVGCGCPAGFQGPLGAQNVGPLSGPMSLGGLGQPGFAGSSCGPGPGFAAPMMPMQNAYAVEAHLEGKIDLANLQFAPDELNNGTEIAILDQNEALQMQGEIVLIPIGGPGIEEGGPQAYPGGPQAYPGGPQAAPGGPQAGFGRAPTQGPRGPSGQLGPQGAGWGSQAGMGPQVGMRAPTGYAPQAGLGPQAGPQAGPTAELGVACRIPLQMCGACGVSTASEPAIVTTPVVPQMPACPQMMIRPVMASPCCGPVGAPAISPMSLGPSCGVGCQ